MELAALVIIILVAGWLLYEWYEHQAVRFTQHKIQADNWKNKRELRCFVISDLHNNRKWFQKKLLAQLKEFHPDVFFLCGDMVNKHRKKNQEALWLIEQLSEIAPVIYSYGNHESELKASHLEAWEQYKNSLPKKCVLLDNDSIELSGLVPEFTQITITGLTLPEEFYQKGKMLEDMSFLPSLSKTAGFYTILLAHNPEYFKMYQQCYEPDLVLSGHLHGGIIRLPGIGGLISPRYRFSVYDAGIRQHKNATMLISRGLGSHTLWLRFLNRVEINQIILGRSEAYDGNTD